MYHTTQDKVVRKNNKFIPREWVQLIRGVRQSICTHFCFLFGFISAFEEAAYCLGHDKCNNNIYYKTTIKLINFK